MRFGREHDTVTGTALGPLRVAAYRRIWLAQAVSQLGTYLQLTVAPWLMWQMTGSPLQVSLVTTALFLPRLVLVVPAGTLADRLDRRRLMIACNTVNALVVAALALVVQLGALSPLWLLALTLALGAGTAVDRPSHQTLAPDLVPGEMRAQAITLNSATVQAARIAGPSLGGVLVAAGLAQAAFALNAVSFAVIALALLQLPQRAARLGDQLRTGVYRSTVEGVRFVRSAPQLRSLLGVAAVFAITSASVTALLPNVVGDELGSGSLAFGVLYGIFGLGALLATLTRARVTVLAGQAMVPGTIAAFGAAAIAFGLAPGLVPAGAALLIVGAAWVWAFTTLNATVQLLVPHWIRGRVVSLYLLAASAKPIGAVLAGVLAELTGAGAAVALTSAATVGLAAVVGWLRLPSLAEVEAAAHREEDPAAPAGPDAAAGSPAQAGDPAQAGSPAQAGDPAQAGGPPQGEGPAHPGERETR